MFLRQMSGFSLLIGVSLALGLLTVPVTAADLTLRITGIPGDSTTPNHVGDIALQSLSFGLTNPDPATDAVYSELALTKPLDKASPLLSANCASGQKFVSMTIFQTYTNGPVVDLMTLTLHNALITSHGIRVAAGGGLPSESLSLQAESFTWSYAQLQ